MPPSPRSGFNTSPLVRLLAGLDIGDTAGSGQALAERLGPWLGWADAIALFGVLDGGPADAGAATRPGTGPATVIEDFKRVRRELAQSITDETAFAADDPDFSACRRAYRDRQQAMADRIAPMRARLRSALSARSPELGRLAALDAVLDQALGERERHLLARLPAMLERQVTDLRKTQAPDAPDPRLAPALVGQTLRAVLLAELDLRLQPVEGLAEALARHAQVPA